MKQFLKPADGLMVRKPNGELLPASGAEVEMTPYWTRRLNSGDVVETTKPKAAKPAKDA